MYESFSIIFAIAALLSFLNYKWLKLPNTIGQLILALILALVVIALKAVFPSVYEYFCAIVLNADFSRILLDVLLGFLLFAGALHVDIQALKKERWPVFIFATLGVLISTFLVGIGLSFIAQLINCPLFGYLLA